MKRLLAAAVLAVACWQANSSAEHIGGSSNAGHVDAVWICTKFSYPTTETHFDCKEREVSLHVGNYISYASYLSFLDMWMKDMPQFEDYIFVLNMRTLHVPIYFKWDPPDIMRFRK